MQSSFTKHSNIYTRGRRATRLASIDKSWLQADSRWPKVWISWLLNTLTLQETTLTSTEKMQTQWKWMKLIKLSVSTFNIWMKFSRETWNPFLLDRLNGRKKLIIFWSSTKELETELGRHSNFGDKIQRQWSIMKEFLMKKRQDTLKSC